MEEIGIRLPGERGFTLSANSTFLGEFDLLGFNNQFIRGENNKGFSYMTANIISPILVDCIRTHLSLSYILLSGHPG